jgi:hypothetical protein
MKRTSKVHDATLTIRVKRDLIERARDAAHKQGMSLSEAIRQFLRDLAAKEPSDKQVALAQLIFKGTEINIPTPEQLADLDRRFPVEGEAVDNTDNEA